jgi:hypothetical protein
MPDKEASMSETDERRHEWDEDGICECGEDIRIAYSRLMAEYDVLHDRLSAAEQQAQTLEDFRDRVVLVVDSYDWLREGRGPYSWDDHRYDDDVQAFVTALQELMPPSRSVGWRDMNRYVDKLEAQAQTLRTALVEIEHKATHSWDRGSWTRQQWAADIARAALNPQSVGASDGS